MRKRPPRLTLNLIKSAYTQKVYIALFEDNKPIKFWPYNELNAIGIDILSELFKGFDLGYEIEYQFPQELKGERQIVPTEMVLVGEPNGKEVNILNKKNALSEDNFYKAPPEDKGILPDPKLMDFLSDYEKIKGL